MKTTKEMIYELMEQSTTTWGTETNVIGSFTSKDDADKKLEELYNTNKTNRKYSVSYNKGESMKIVVIEHPKFSTLYTIKRVNG